ncbi:hypothetical protein PRK78_006836 [Emydomyces testavorans]|uniref:Dienelactone hydrolase domain-containing protein n=1 Tax=Emydomyces testavorans TaxID=2070801 RepID=A0AAF0IM31_9EURO|nr:hypothetical protein PRK78_006836 [Emydomyces testavorans]
MVPDLFHGNPWELNATGVDLMDWLKNHQPQDVDPIVEAAIKFLREQKGVKKIAAVGYCFGAKYVCRFLKESKIDVGYVAHPSFVTSEELSAITGPLSIAAAGKFHFNPPYS